MTFCRDTDSSIVFRGYYFAFSKGQTLSITQNGTALATIRVAHQDEPELIIASNEGELDSDIEFVVEKKGRYFFLVEPHGSGLYKFYLSEL